MRVFSLVAALVLTSACKAELDLTFYASDISTDVIGETVAATLSVEMASNERCSTDQKIVAETLSKSFGQATFIQCRRDDFNTFADFRVGIPLVDAKTDIKAFPIFVAIQSTEDGGRFAALGGSPTAIQKLIDALPPEMRYLTQDRIEPSISLQVINDTDDQFIVAQQGAFIDGEPKQLRTAYPLAKREEVHIRLSDVGNAALYSGGSLLFFFDTDKTG